MLMTLEKSCGAVVFTRVSGEIRYLLVQSLGGEFGFPKGHVEHAETEKQTAMREILEETGLKPVILDGFRAVSEYMLPDKMDVKKQVIFFLAKFEKQSISFQKEELIGAELFSFEEAMERLEHENNKRILTDAYRFLSNEESQPYG